LRVKVKKQEASAAHPDRHQQFEVIGGQKQVFQAAGWPISSVESKKKEVLGTFKNAGQAWGQEAEALTVHDFPHDALMRAVPYGIYDVSNKCGSVYLGSSADTPDGVCRDRSGPLVARGGARALSQRHRALDPGRCRRQQWLSVSQLSAPAARAAQ